MINRKQKRRRKDNTRTFWTSIVRIDKPNTRHVQVYQDRGEGQLLVGRGEQLPYNVPPHVQHCRDDVDKSKSRVTQGVQHLAEGRRSQLIDRNREFALGPDLVVARSDPDSLEQENVLLWASYKQGRRKRSCPGSQYSLQALRVFLRKAGICL